MSRAQAVLPRSTRRPATPAAKAAVRLVGVRDAAATRARILAAALAEFADKGLAGARVDAIAASARSNKRMIYYYFGGKEPLYLAVLEEAYADLRASEAALELSRLPPDEAMRALVEFKFDYFQAHPELIRLLTNENVHHARHLRRSKRLRDLHVSLVERIGALLRAGSAAGVFRRNVDPLQLYMSIAALSYFYFSNRATLSTAFGEDLHTQRAAASRRSHAVDVIAGYLRP